MATQPTNQPVPSESPRDLKFNAGKIDEFVTSMARQYIDRFGNAHYTIEGMRWIAQQAIAAFGYITLDSFEDGNTLTLPNQVLRLESTGEYYRWDGAFPKVVPAGSTPESTGDIGTGAWLSVGDATLRGDLAKTTGAGIVGYKWKQSGSSVYRTLQDKLDDFVSVLDFGAKGDGVADDTSSLQAAITAAAGREVIFPPGTYIITDSLRIPSNTIVTILPGATIKRGNLNVNVMIINDSDGTTGGYSANEQITIRGGGAIDGNVNFISSSCTLIGFGHCNRVLVENIRLLNIGGRWHAIEFNSTKHGIARNVYIEKNGLPGDGGGEAIQLDHAGNSGKFPWFGPYDNTACYDITIESCEIHGVGCGVGGHDPSGVSKHFNIKVVNNVIFSNIYGIKTQGWSNVIITGNRIEQEDNVNYTGLAAIYCQYNTEGLYNSDLLISGNTIYRWFPSTSGNVGTSWRGIYFLGESNDLSMLRNIVVEGNRIYDCGGHLIVFDHVMNAVCTSNYVGRHTDTEFTRYGIYQFGSKNLTITGNIVEGYVYLGGGKDTTHQKVVCTGNSIGSDLLVTQGNLVGVVAHNSVGGAPAEVDTSTLLISKNIVA